MVTEAAPFDELLSFVVDNRGRSCPTTTAGFPLIATNCISNERLYPTRENVRYVNNETYDHWFRSHPIPGDIIFVLKGAPGRCALVPDPVGFCIAQDMVAVRANPEKVDPRYLFAALRSPLLQNSIDRMHVGTMIPHFKKGDFNKLRIPLPDRYVQDFIGSTHMALVEKIESNRRVNETLETMARAVFKDWFIDFGPTRAKTENRAPYFASEIWSLFPDDFDDDEKPQGWVLGTLSEVARQTGIAIKPEDLDPDTTYIGLEHMPRNSIALDKWEGASKVTSGKLAFKRGDFLFGKLRPYFHKVGIAPVDGICSTDIVVLNAREANASAFVLSCVSQDNFVKFADQTSDGTKMPRTSWDRMERYGLCLPSTSVMEAFNALIYPMFQHVMSNIIENTTLAATRDLLLPKLISGEVCVREAEQLLGKAT